MYFFYIWFRSEGNRLSFNGLIKEYTVCVLLNTFQEKKIRCFFLFNVYWKGSTAKSVFFFFLIHCVLHCVIVLLSNWSYMFCGPKKHIFCCFQKEFIQYPISDEGINDTYKSDRKYPCVGCLFNVYRKGPSWILVLNPGKRLSFDKLTEEYTLCMYCTHKGEKGCFFIQC